MRDRPWYPYALDQQFGVRAAADQAAVDRLYAAWEACNVPAAQVRSPLPARQARPQLAPGFARLQTLADPLPEPVTIASSLDVAAEARGGRET
jgi:hypothetical protein